MSVYGTSFYTDSLSDHSHKLVRGNVREVFLHNRGPKLRAPVKRGIKTKSVHVYSMKTDVKVKLMIFTIFLSTYTFLAMGICADGVPVCS